MSNSQYTANLTLPLDDPSVPSTPMARLLYSHAIRGGSILDGINLIEKAELAAAAAAPKPRNSHQRGTRLSACWAPSLAELNFALERGMAWALIQTEAEKFRNYWIAKAGA